MDLTDLKIGGFVAMVEFALDAVAMKGRLGYRSGIRPNHWMPGRDYTFMGHLHFVDREWLKPGEKCEAKGSFIIAEQDFSSFVPGFTWQVGEGHKIVGQCRLDRVEGALESLPTSDDIARRSG